MTNEERQSLAEFSDDFDEYWFGANHQTFIAESYANLLTTITILVLDFGNIISSFLIFVELLKYFSAVNARMRLAEELVPAKINLYLYLQYYYGDDYET